MSSEKSNGEKGCGLNFNGEQDLVSYCWFGVQLGKGQKVSLL